MFRKAELSDLPALEALEKEAFGAPWSRAMLQEEYEAAREGGAESWPRLFVSEDGALLQAYSASLLVLDELQLFRIAVPPALRRQGLARGHLRALAEAAKAAGAVKITLEVREGNKAARSFYAEEGFCEVGRRAGYYTDSGESALLLDLLLT